MKNVDISYKYFLMRENDIIALVGFDRNGHLVKYSRKFNEKQIQLAPFCCRYMDGAWLPLWWSNRACLADRFNNIPAKKDYSTPELWLMNNYGLSLLDHYWLKDLSSDITWEDINLFDNPFSSDKRLVGDYSDIPTPNASLGGVKEKAWIVFKGDIFLLKGNSMPSSLESINEVIASRLHEMQDYDNYAGYEFARIQGKKYEFGCMSPIYTSKNIEYISAFDIVRSEKKDNKTSWLAHFINICKNNGIDENQLRRDIDYMLLMDFVLLNDSRNFKKFGVLRNAKSLKFIRLAPLSGYSNSLLLSKRISGKNVEPASLLNIKVKPMAHSLKKYINDYSVVNISLLPSFDFIEDLYRTEAGYDHRKAEKLSSLYLENIDYLQNLSK